MTNSLKSSLLLKSISMTALMYSGPA